MERRVARRILAKATVVAAKRSNIEFNVPIQCALDFSIFLPLTKNRREKLEGTSKNSLFDRPVRVSCAMA